jgi:hypothetical protein
MSTSGEMSIQKEQEEGKKCFSKQNSVSFQEKRGRYSSGYTYLLSIQPADRRAFKAVNREIQTIGKAPLNTSNLL